MLMKYTLAILGHGHYKEVVLLMESQRETYHEVGNLTKKIYFQQYQFYSYQPIKVLFSVLS